MNIAAKANELLNICKKRGLRLATAESCTGGLIASVITDISGSSEVFECAFVTYSNAAKEIMLGVPDNLIKQNGAVSEQVAISMAEGAIKNSLADIAVSVTGIAGPGGGSKEKPVGLVYIGFVGKKGQKIPEKHIFNGTRQEIRKQAAEAALNLAVNQMKTSQLRDFPS